MAFRVPSEIRLALLSVAAVAALVALGLAGSRVGGDGVWVVLGVVAVLGGVVVTVVLGRHDRRRVA